MWDRCFTASVILTVSRLSVTPGARKSTPCSLKSANRQVFNLSRMAGSLGFFFILVQHPLMGRTMRMVPVSGRNAVKGGRFGAGYGLRPCRFSGGIGDAGPSTPGPRPSFGRRGGRGPRQISKLLIAPDDRCLPGTASKLPAGTSPPGPGPGGESPLITLKSFYFAQRLSFAVNGEQSPSPLKGSTHRVTD